MLRRFRFLLARRTDERHERHVYITNVLAAYIETELSDRLEEREDFDIADSAANFCNHDIDRVDS